MFIRIIRERESPPFEITKGKGRKGKEGKFESKERNGNYKVMKTIENNNREEKVLAFSIN